MNATSTRQGLWFEPRRPGATKKKAAPRDSQKRRLYRAEAELEKHGQSFESLEECRAYLAGVLGSRKFRGVWGRWSVALVAKRSGAAVAQPGLRLIRLPRWAFRSDVILHELAHVLTPERPAHSRAFAACYLKLAGLFFGLEAARVLRAGYRRERVKWHKLKKLTLAQRQTAAARLRTVLEGSRARAGGSDGTA